MSSTYKFKVGDIVEHIGGRGNTGKVTKVTTDKITVVFEDSSKDYNYNSNTRSLRLVKGKTVETMYDYPIYKQYKKSNLVIKFTNLREGVVEVGDGKHRHKGESLGLLTPHTNKTTWEDYTPKPSTKHICEVLEENVNLETAIKFAKNYMKWVSNKTHYSVSIKDAGSLIDTFYWVETEEGCTFWSKIQDRVSGIKATSTHPTFVKYATLNLPKEQEFVYPIYKKSKSSGMIVKFTGLEDGAVVVAGNSSFQPGHNGSWVPHTNTGTWEDYKLNEPKNSRIKEKIEEQKTKPIQTKTESTIMSKLKTTATTVATQNKDAIKVAAKLEAGKIINKQVIKQVKPHLPLLVRGLADHPAASIVLANVVSIAVKHFMPENQKLNTVAELMLGAAAVDTVASFNIEAFVEDLLKNIKLPTGVLDDDN